MVIGITTGPRSYQVPSAQCIGILVRSLIPVPLTARVRSSLVIAVSLTAVALVGYGGYLFLQARAVRRLFAAGASAPSPSKLPANQLLLARLAALQVDAPLREWLRLMSDDGDSVTLDTALPAVSRRQGLTGDMRALLTGASLDDALLALRWLGAVCTPDPALASAAEGAIARFIAELPRRRDREDERFAAVFACETLQAWGMGRRETRAALATAIAAHGTGPPDPLLQMLEQMQAR